MKLSISKYTVNFFIAVLYLILGPLIILKYSIWVDKADMRLMLFGLAVIVYGIFRGYRAYRDYQSQKEDQDEME
jgi:hypothetical protein